MKLADMAELLEGLVSFLDRVGNKNALNDLRTVSACFRSFPDESVSGFCQFVVKAKDAKANGTNGRAARAAGADDQAKVAAAVAKIRHFLDHRLDYDYAQIDQLVEPVAKLKIPEIKAVGEQLGFPLTGKTKAAMVATLRSWLSDIRLSAHQSSFSLDPAGAR